MQEYSFLISGIVFGLSAGISPGPLLTLVVSQTLKHNRKEGIKVAIAPLLTDFPVMVAGIFIFSALVGFNLVFGLVSIFGGLLLGNLAYQNIKLKNVRIDAGKTKVNSVRDGIVVNFLNPHMYLFWLTIGSPAIINAFKISMVQASLFILSFFACLIGSKIIVAFTVDKSKRFLTSKSYLYIVRFLGAVLMLFALKLLYDGLVFLGY